MLIFSFALVLREISFGQLLILSFTMLIFSFTLVLKEISFGHLLILSFPGDVRQDSGPDTALVSSYSRSRNGSAHHI